jgi:hypothetical protein
VEVRVKATILFLLGLACGALGLWQLEPAEAAGDGYDFVVVGIRAGSPDSGVKGALKDWGESGYEVAAVLGNQVILQRKR